MTRPLRVAALVALLSGLAGGAYLLFNSRAAPVKSDVATAKPNAAGTGAWVDEVVFREEGDPAKAIDMMEAGEVQVYALGLNDPELYRKIQSSRALQHDISYGSTTELSFNPVGPTFPKTGELNPFSVPAIREALNWLIDRDHIVEEIYGGLAVPKYLPLTSAFPDYARVADEARQIELQYAYKPERAKEIIDREMKKLGASLANGKWSYRGKPVRLIFIIRSDDHQRREIGDYVSTLLEDAGFVVDRQYKTASEASPIWVLSDPADGRWHFYTGGWVTLVVNRDQADNFDAYYTSRGRPDPLWQAYKPDPKLDKLAERLRNGDYASLEERKQMLIQALKLAAKDSVRVWLVDSISVWPRRKEVALTADLAGGVTGSYLWPYTLRYLDRRDGRVSFASPSILTGPWNPIAGGHWIFDEMITRSTQDLPVLPDPFTGLYWPQQVKRVEVVAQKGLPITKTHDWVDLKFVPSITVPSDAWIDWDPVDERLVTVGERHPKGLKARTKTVLHYDENLFANQWHDGSKLSLADFMLSFIISFDRAKPKSALFDQSAVTGLQAFMQQFRGLRIVQKNPLVVETYSDQINPDAELIAYTRSGDFQAAGDSSAAIPWHELAIGILAERDKQLAFSSAKADQLKVEWMNYVAGPSLTILDRQLDAARKEGFIPYAKTLGQYVGREEAIERYDKLRAWRKARGHFWLGNGAFYLHSVHPVEKIVVIRKSELFTDPADKWLRFTEPRIADVEVSGPRMVQIGAPAEFSVQVNFKGKPYPPEDIEFVRFLLFDARGQLVENAAAEPVGDGRWRIALSANQTARLAAGSNRLEVAVTPRVVAMPSFKTFWFVTLPEKVS
ncbi:MAG TPA: ABC transporter substrate-binding protein [Candidatus Binatia bacterium]|jgi:peptide/nickel transport system substrate-binding protein